MGIGNLICAVDEALQKFTLCLEQLTLASNTGLNYILGDISRVLPAINSALEDTSAAFLANRVQLRLEDNVSAVKALDHVAIFFEFAKSLLFRSEAASKAIKGRDHALDVEFTRLMAYASQKPHSIELIMEKSQ